MWKMTLFTRTDRLGLEMGRQETQIRYGEHFFAKGEPYLIGIIIATSRYMEYVV